jgi:hypothetical protein
MNRTPSDMAPEVRAAMLAAQWAQRLKLPPGNMWEPAITRNLLAEWRRLGGDGQAWTLVETLYTMRLGLQ